MTDTTTPKESVDTLGPEARLLKEMEDLRKSDLDGVSFTVNEENIFEWTCYISGPQNSIYEGLVYEISIEFGADHPFVPPKITFITSIFHPSVSPTNGVLYAYGLAHGWSPSLSTEKILIMIMTMLSNPVEDISDSWPDVLNSEAYYLYNQDRSKYREKVYQLLETD